MPLPEPNLDDLRFQRDLVDEARRRIIRYCPEWTDYNVSDPGITLIELFAWMTELITYRLNLVPEKNYIRFLDLLGIQLMPASSARTEVTFRLSTLLPIRPDDDTSAIVPKGTEVATRRTDEEEEVIFTTDERLEIVAPLLSDLRKDEDFNKNYLSRLGVEVFYAFGRPKPAPGDTFYVGFDEANNLVGHILQLQFDVEETQATGVRREDPPLVWECSVGNGQWEEVYVSKRQDEKDTTGGLNNPTGRTVLYLPLTLKADELHGRRAHWLRCRIEQRRPEQGMYTQSPRIVRMEAFSMGATTRATHAVFVQDEQLGESNGEPGQTYTLQNTPALALTQSESVEVEEKREGELVFVPWARVDDFSRSDRYDRHFTLDYATGQIAFGPSVRQRDGSIRQYGRVPEAGRRVRFSQYRYGGGVSGNVPVGKIQQLRSAISYVDSVSNMKRADGGRDQETLEEAKMRARRELRAQQRAVTAEDYEDLARSATRSVARVKCSTARSATLPPGMVELLIVPAVYDAVRAGDLSHLQLDDVLRRQIETHINPYRLLTTTIRISEPSYLGVKVIAEIVAGEYSDPELVKGRVLEALRNFITPLALNAPASTDVSTNGNGDGHGRVGGDTAELSGAQYEGWPFGRDLYVSEIFTLLTNVPGVKFVRDVKLSQRQVIPGREAAAKLENPPSDQTRAYLALVPADARRIQVPPDSLLCSLDHEVAIVDL